MTVDPKLVDPETVGAETVDLSAARRRAAISTVAIAGASAAGEAFSALQETPRFTAIRPPETGLVMVRGKMGGSGAPFNLGEMTVTRAAIRLDSGEVGVGYVGGRDKRHAELAALADAMAQSARWGPVLEDNVIAPLQAVRAEMRDSRSRKAAATKVEFFTMVRTRQEKKGA